MPDVEDELEPVVVVGDEGGRSQLEGVRERAGADSTAAAAAARLAEALSIALRLRLI